MKILIDNKRKISWTDKKNGYLELNLFEENKNSGYFRNDFCFLTGFSCGGKTLSDVKSAEYFPYGLKANFSDDFLEISLLLDEQAFYLNSSKDIGILNCVKNLKIKEKNDSAEKIIEKSKIPSWRISEKNNIKILSSDSGIAVAADFDFYYSVKDSDLFLYYSNPQKLENAENFTDSGFYVTFEDSEENAIKKAERLVLENGIDKHCSKIDKFLESVKISTENQKFDESVLWSRFNAWLLTTKSESSYTGIWAGLPWFRDNWGRDTFISLCGTLLVSGSFEEAKSVLLGFADFQCFDKKSSSYGRIPNRYRNKDDVIYNTADGTLWFIRSLYEYVQYSGDFKIIEDLKKTVEIAIDSEMARCDENGFIKHADADTWMDARIQNNEALSPRGDRANDIQALWFTSLRIAAIFEKDSEKIKKYSEFAEKVKSSYLKLFWNPTFDAFADCLPEGGWGDWVKDMKVRPNQLFAIFAPSCLPKSEENSFIEQKYQDKILQNVERELVSPFGLYSLTPSDPVFHPHHEWDEQYHKDAAYHNGTIWQWNSGPYISSVCANSSSNLPYKPSAILENQSKMIMDFGCAGTLSENIHAALDSDGNPILSGTYSQAWSLAEFNRNVIQDILGFNPKLFENKIEFNPHFPCGMEKFNAEIPFGKNLKFCVNAEKKSNQIEAKILIKSENPEISSILVNQTEVKFNQQIILTFKTKKTDENVNSFDKFASSKNWVTKNFPEHNLFTEWNGASHKKDYLFNLILSGRSKSRASAGDKTAALEWYFDSKAFEDKYFTSENLGAIYSKKNTTFRLWAPTAENVKVLLYKDGENSESFETVQMKLLDKKGFFGVWECSVSGDLNKIYYQFKVYVHGLNCVSSDPYARACGVNGLRSMVLDFNSTNPEGWETSSAPKTKSRSDVVAYELHVADLTSSETWNGSEKKRRTFLGCAESGTTFNGVKTGFDHLKDLGITHVQFLPIFDFRSVDEKRIHDKNYKNQVKFGLFNWGYDPENYACVEGSYSTNPNDGEVRVKELKQMIKSFNDAGIGVIMDVVYNHVNDGVHHPFNLCVPGYYYRVECYSGAGEDTASEHKMFREYMVKTLCWWLKEFKLSGFRFDLMGLHDAETMNQIHNELSKIKKDVLLYGEGWDMYSAGKMQSASMKNSEKMPQIGFFNDSFRCAIKGPISNDSESGFIQDGSRKESVKFGIVGAVNHLEVDFSKVEGTVSPNPWGKNTWKSVNYTEIHDNITLRDKIENVEPNHNEEYYIQMQKFALSLVLLSEGMPILHAGMEFMRSKEIPDEIWQNEQPLYETATIEANSKGKARHFFKNTYNICDRINGLDWSKLEKYKDVSDYVKGLIQLRKNHPSFRLSTDEEVQNVLSFKDNKDFNFPEEVLIWTLDGSKCGDLWKKIIIISNPCTFELSYCTGLEKNKKILQISDGKSVFSKPVELNPAEKVKILPKSTTIFAEM